MDAGVFPDEAEYAHEVIGVLAFALSGAIMAFGWNAPGAWRRREQAETR